MRALIGRVVRLIFRREKVFVLEKKLTGERIRTEAELKVSVNLVKRDDFSRNTTKFAHIHLYTSTNDINESYFVPSVPEARRRFQEGHVCVVAESAGDFVHLSWLSFDNVYAGLPERKIRMSSDAAFLYGVYTVPEHRGMGIAPKAMEKAFGYLYGMGIRKVYMIIRHNNFPSLRVAEKEGFQNIGTITYNRIFLLRSYRYKSEREKDRNKLKKMFST